MPPEQYPGNAAVQDQLALGASEPGFGGCPAEVAAWMNEPELDEELAYLADHTAALVEVSADTVKALYGKTEPQEIPSWMLDQLVPILLVSLGMATAGAAGVAGAAVAKALVDATARPYATEFIKSGIKDVIDPAIQASISAGILSLASSWEQNGGMGDARDAFFTTTSTRLTLSVPDVRRNARKQRDVARKQADPTAYVRGLTEIVKAAGERIGGMQERATIQQWLVLLAQCDLGTETTEGGEGTDLSGAGSGRGWSDKFLDQHPRGILRVSIRGGGGGRLDVQSVRLAGLNEAYIEKLLGSTPRDLGAPIFASGLVEGGLRTGTVEFGRNEAGSHFVRGDDFGLDWLADVAYPGPGSGDEAMSKEGAALLLERYLLDVKFEDLGLEHG